MKSTPAHRCPCCHCLTLSALSAFEICPVCFWEDDGQLNDDAQMVRGGPNGNLSLAQAQANYKMIGACEQRALPYVRKPKKKEL